MSFPVAFMTYRRRVTTGELRPYNPGEILPTLVSISPEDKAAGSPKEGDMIARNADNHADQWLVSKAYFQKHYLPGALPLDSEK